jgi:DNA-binding MarR family transcriptional regulator
MSQVSAARPDRVRTGPPPAGDDLGVLIRALYEVGGQARRASPGDPVEPAGMRVLVWVQALGSPRPSELAHELRLDLSTVSRHVSALVADGLLRSDPDAEDRRAQRLSVTPGVRTP